MAELTPKTINELPAKTTPTDDDLFPMSSAATSYRIAWANVKNALYNAFFTHSTGNVTWDTGIQTSGSPIGVLRKCGNTVVLRLSVNITSDVTANSYLTIGTVPSGFRPPSSMTGVMVISSESDMTQVLVTSEGLLRIASNKSFTGGATAALRGQLVWLITTGG